jgi:hypothetical protein
MKRVASRLARKLVGNRLPVFLATAMPIAAICTGIMCGGALGDEGGVSFWLPGEFGSLAATPQAPGWAVGIINIYESESAAGNAAAAREITIGKLNTTVNVNLDLNLAARADLVLISPS